MPSSAVGRWCFTSAIIILLTSSAFGQTVSSVQGPNPNELVRAVIANELKDQGGSRWMYRIDKDEEGKKTTKEVIETTQGSLDQLVAINNRPLSVTERRDETIRINPLVNNPAQQQRIEQARRKDAEQCRAVFKMIPDALLFSYGGRDGDLIKLTYRPNPNFQPPSREARVFHAMAGEMWVHESQHRLVRITGQLVDDVKFAGGLLGHLEKGGHFAVEQSELAPGQWNLTLMEIEMKGKALLFKNIALHQKESRKEFRAVPANLTLPDGAKLLRNEVVVAANY
jgi:hypothetical protein